jgi:hypothetical protein
MTSVIRDDLAKAEMLLKRVVRMADWETQRSEMGDTIFPIHQASNDLQDLLERYPGMQIQVRFKSDSGYDDLNPKG